MTLQLKPTFDAESTRAKVQATEDAWNTRDPETVARAYGTDSEWRTREQQFNDLIAVHMDDLNRLACWLSGNRSVAEDLVQETLIRAWKSIDRLKDRKAAKNWLLTIVRRENARRFARKQLQETEVSTEGLAAERADYDTSTEAFVLRRALDQLPPKYREPLLMQVVYGHSHKEIAEHLGISNVGVGTRLFRAREKMRTLLCTPQPTAQRAF